jgi:type IV pilus assembly protein PilM
MMGLARTPMGIDIGRRRIKVAQLIRSVRGYRMGALSSLPRGDSDGPISQEELKEVRGILERQGFRGKNVVLAAPTEKILYGVFELPRDIQEEPAAQIARMELSRMYQVTPDSFEMAYWCSPLAQSKSKIQTIAAGCPHDAVNALVDVFEGAGFQVCAVDLRSAAIARACVPLLADPPAITCVMDLGWCSASVLFVCGEVIVYERSIMDKGLSKLMESLAGEFNISDTAVWDICRMIGLGENETLEEFDAEATHAIREIIASHVDSLLKELEVPFNYVNHQYPGDGVERLLLTGGGAEITHLEQYCRDRLDVETRVVTPNELIAGASRVLPSALTPTVTVAVGLAKFSGV